MILVTGSSGFLGKRVVRVLRGLGYSVVAVDRIASDADHVVDLCDKLQVEGLFAANHISIVIHLAAQIDFNTSKGSQLYSNNMRSTENIASVSAKFGVQRIIFTSSCSIYAGAPFKKPFVEYDVPCPVDDYGRSKVDGEALLQTYIDTTSVGILRCPMIVGPGRLGMLSILFDLISNGNALWVLGAGDVRHQLVYSEDVVDALVRLLAGVDSAVYHIGSENIPSFREMYLQLASLAGSRSRVLSVPTLLGQSALNVLRMLHISPIGPYQIRMLTDNFAFDSSRLRRELGWTPTKTNTEMLWEAYTAYKALQSAGASVNQMPAPMGALSVLKWFY